MEKSMTTTQVPGSLRRSVSNTLKGSAGNLVEWYDVYVYSVFASYFEFQFFDSEDKNSQIYIWAIFAVTFLMRPIGAWFFGRFADRHGRRLALTVSVSIMAGCSFVIALTPSAAVIGAGAAIILIVCRLVQGFATGGEYGTSATYMSEAAIRGRRGFLSSFHYVTLVGGHVLAQATLLIMVLAMPTEAISEWGWRIAFAIGGVAAIVVFYLRRTMDESLSESALESVKDGKSRSSGSMKELILHQWRPLLLCFLITMGGTVAFYTYSVTGPGIVKKAFAGDDVVSGTILNLIALTVLMLLQPIGGWLSDIVGRKTLLVFFGAGGVLYTWFLLTYLPQQTNEFAAFGILVGGFVILTGYTSINAVVKAELFPTHIRALGVGFGYAMANSIFGGTAPLLYTAAGEAQQVPLFIVYVTIAIAASLVVYVFFLHNKGANWLDDEKAMRARDTDRDEKREARQTAGAR
ncbi:alpha-ketoglutarate transporter [Pseudoclavibacter sp. RFBJ3]|nr:alpha-ketoglutarate transporter [Pseudoclavibacter sp. AY1H1]PPF80970.1 alpha-ketoglutarate transporter [Pseudoclavibacter sp. RFBJ5]PPF94478.1 alpha-ketoglutarate transporter [Pseudoclavibacter sp. RFBJ3]PPF99586.1 alpha-ketoglutarate transporter [Pseudoclavibacter sp. RFBH5]PPG04510.1 alpha-ketoglutarate transporter [Pseudoclavibacter sp. RFBI5]PPG25780.1 alpha-ketoglutarate transporter [Pseudoclavibacter sp. RFBI4]PPG35280.1 alpha-ketoglutarate transporter [Pseudoclavibacter sp. RFBG4]